VAKAPEAPRGGTADDGCLAKAGLAEARLAATRLAAGGLADAGLGIALLKGPRVAADAASSSSSAQATSLLGDPGASEDGGSTAKAS